LVRVFYGDIDNWSHFGCGNKPITVAVRSDGSGTTAGFTNSLSAFSNKWKLMVGRGKSVNWPAAGTVAGTPTTFAQTLRNVPSAVAAKFRDPAVLADMTLRAAGMMAGSAIAGSGLSPEEEELLEAQRQELEYLQTNNQALFQERLNQARNLIGEARYFDPNYFGLQQAAGVQLRGARAREEALAGIDPRRAGLRAAEERRANLAIGRDVGTAYSQGYQTGTEGRTGLLEAGLRQLPAGAPATALGAYGQTLANMYGGAASRQEQSQRDVGSLFESFRSPYQTEEERGKSTTGVGRQGLFG